MPTPQPDRAGIIAPPPLLYVCALAIAFGLHRLMPEPIVTSAAMLRYCGAALFVLGGLLAAWSFITMRQAGTSPDPRKASTALVSRGPYRFSRNPIYLAMTSLYLGLGLAGNSYWYLVMLAPLLLLMQRGVILREERYLRHKFGAAYAAYLANTRRWL